MGSKPEEEEDTIPYSPTLDEDEKLDITPEKESDKTEEKIMSIQKEASSDKKVVKSITPLKKKRHQCALCGKELKFPGYLANHYITDHFMDRLKAEAQEAFTGEQCTKCTRRLGSVHLRARHLGMKHGRLNTFLQEAGLEAVKFRLNKKVMRGKSTMVCGRVEEKGEEEEGGASGGVQEGGGDEVQGGGG